MKSKLEVYVCDEVEEPMITIEGDIQFDASIIVLVNSKDDLAKVMKNKSEIIKKYKEFLENQRLVVEDEEFDDLIKRLETVKNYNDLMKTVEQIHIYPKKDIEISEYGNFFYVSQYDDFDNDEMITKFRKYLFHQPYLKDKKIVVPEEFDLSIIDELKSIYEGYDILIYPKDGSAPMSMDEINNVSYFDKLCEDIKSLNLSPLEKITMCYDIVREREYNLGVESDTFESRDLYKILNGEQIVCAGYTDIICRMFEKLEIPNIYTLLNGVDGTAGHARVTVLVDDEKYNVKGIFGLDPTFDSKKNKPGDDYLIKYYHFLKDLDFFNEIDQKIKLRQSSFSLLNNDSLECFPKRIQDIDGAQLSDNDSTIPIEEKIRNYSVYSTFRKLVLMIYNKNIEDRLELKRVVSENIDEIMSYLKSSINTVTMVNLLMNVRAIESKIDSEKYPYDISKCVKGALHSGFKHDKEAIPYSHKSLLKSLIDSNFKRTEDENVEDWGYMVNINSNKALQRANELIKDKKGISLELYRSK